jgi:predicted transcriptional regulator
MDSRQLVLNTLNNAGKPLRSGEISDLSGLSKEDVDKAMKSLKSDGKVYSPKRCFWQAKQML